MLDFYDAMLTKNTGLRASLRFVFVLLGLAFFVLGVISIGDWSKNWSIWLIIGSIILYVFLIKPLIERHNIKKFNDNIDKHEITTAFLNSHIMISVKTMGLFDRQWGELIDLTEAKKGIIFHFADSDNYLPNRIFANKSERKEFIKFVKLKQKTAIMQNK
jgi:hypothetical protein